MPGANLPEDIEVADRGPISVTGDKSVATLTGLFNFQPDRPVTDRQDHDPFNVFQRDNGGDVSRSGGGLYQVETDGTGTAVGGLETAQLGIYRSGTLANWATGVWVDVDPAGTDSYYDIGYLGEGFPEASHFRVQGQEELEYVIDGARYSEPVTIPREFWERGEVNDVMDGGEVVGKVYGIDPWLGDARSGGEYDASRGYLYGTILGWYGPPSLGPSLVAVGDVNGKWVQKVWPLFLFRPVGGPAIEQPNLPIRVAAHNAGGTQALQARVGGRQFSYRGDVPQSPQPTHHWSEVQTLPMDGTGTGERDWYVVGMIRRKDGGAFISTGLGMEDYKVVSTSQPLAFHARTIPLSLVDGTPSWSEPVDTHAQQTAIEVDCQADTPDRITVQEATIDGTTKLEGIKWSGDVAGTNVDNQNKSTQATGKENVGFGFPFVREYATVILATTRSDTSDDVTTAFTVQEAG